MIAEPGPQAVFGTITVRGNDGVSDGRVKSLLTDEGRASSSASAASSTASGASTTARSSSSCRSTPTPSGTVGAPVPVDVVLTQAKPRRLSITPGYGSEEKARITTTLRHLNFFGGARTALTTLRWSSLDRGIRLNVEEPSLFRRGISMSVGAQYWYADEPAYQSTTKGGRVTFAKQRERSDPGAPQAVADDAVGDVRRRVRGLHRVRKRPSTTRTFYDDLIALGLNPNTGRGTGQLLALAVDVQRNTTPNLIDARSGYLLSAHVEQAGQWMPGAYNYTEYTAEARKYHTFGNIVLAGRARIGTIDAPGVLAANVPFFKRYFLGGSSSLRGWGRFEVSPLTFSGNPIGGHSMFESSGEIRVPAFVEVRHRRLRRCRQRLVRDLRLPPRRPACGRRARAPLPDADRPGPRRLRLSAHARGGPAGRRRARAAALAHPLQHRAGVLTMTRGRRALRALAILAVLLIGLLVVAAVAHADGVVPRTAAPAGGATGRGGARGVAGDRLARGRSRAAA